MHVDVAASRRRELFRDTAQVRALAAISGDCRARWLLPSVNHGRQSRRHYRRLCRRRASLDDQSSYHSHLSPASRRPPDESSLLTVGTGFRWQTQSRCCVPQCQTAGNRRKMPNSGAPIIVRVGVRIAVRVADLVRIRVWIWIRASPDGSPGRRSGRRPHGPDPNPERIGVWVPIRVHVGVRLRTEVRVGVEVRGKGQERGRSRDPALHHISTLNEESSLLSVDPRRLASPSQSRCLYDYPFVGAAARPAGCKVTLPRRYVPPSDLVWQWPIQKIVRGKGAWDAVDTSPDIGGQHVLKTFESAI